MIILKFGLSLLVGALFMTACAPVVLGSATATIPIQANTLLASTPLPVETPTLSIISTPPPTLSSADANQSISKLMTENGSCASPCFWGIRPGLSTMKDALGLATNLANAFGETVFTITKNGQTSHSAYFTPKPDLFIEMFLYEDKGSLSSVHAFASGLDQKETADQDWLAFRPENILRAYGVPVRVEFYIVRGPSGEGGVANPTPYTYGFIFYYDQFVIDYYYGKDLSLSRSTRICPLADHQIQRFDVWVGNGLVNGPVPGKELGDLTKLSMNEFYNLMTGDPKDACLDLNLSIFEPR